MSTLNLLPTRSAGWTENLKRLARQPGKTHTLSEGIVDETITDMVQGAPTPRQMLEAARAAGKSEAEINAFAASQPIKPVAVKGTRVFVSDCFGRVFGLDNFSDAERAELVNKGVPYTPYSNRADRRAHVRAQRKGKRTQAPKAPSTPSAPSQPAKPSEAERLQNAMEKAAAEIGVDISVIARVFQLVKEGGPVSPHDAGTERSRALSGAALEAALRTRRTADNRSDCVRSGLDVLEQTSGFSPQEKSSALALFLEQFAAIEAGERTIEQPVAPQNVRPAVGLAEDVGREYLVDELNAVRAKNKT